MPTLLPLGDSALLVKFGEEIDLELNRQIHTLAAFLDAAPLPGVTELVPAYATLLVHYDPLLRTYAEVQDWVRLGLERAQAQAGGKPRQIEVPVRYGGESGPDLEAVAALHALSPAEVVRLHSGREYTVYMMGFTPGFPYMGKLDEVLVTPRLETPRTHVPAGTVAIAGAQTGIYPIDSPGGWRLIGWTPLRLFDPARESPFLFAPGDAVRFVPLEGGR
jgi:KipI family sensor histidine kinase inhibitor